MNWHLARWCEWIDIWHVGVNVLARLYKGVNFGALARRSYNLALSVTHHPPPTPTRVKLHVYYTDRTFQKISGPPNKFLLYSIFLDSLQKGWQTNIHEYWTSHLFENCSNFVIIKSVIKNKVGSSGSRHFSDPDPAKKFRSKPEPGIRQHNARMKHDLVPQLLKICQDTFYW